MDSRVAGQGGSVLMVSMVLLSLLMLASVTAIQLSSLEERMVGNFQSREVAFFAAEHGVEQAEQYVLETDFSPSDFSTDCSGGLCFSGTDAGDVGRCQAGDDQPWMDSTVWSDSARHRDVVTQADDRGGQARFIVEFRCYIPKEQNGPLPDAADANDWSQFYRITVYVDGGNAGARMMLQTTYKKGW